MPGADTVVSIYSDIGYCHNNWCAHFVLTELEKLSFTFTKISKFSKTRQKLSLFCHPYQNLKMFVPDVYRTYIMFFCDKDIITMTYILQIRVLWSIWLCGFCYVVYVVMCFFFLCGYVVFFSMWLCGFFFYVVMWLCVFFLLCGFLCGQTT